MAPHSPDLTFVLRLRIPNGACDQIQFRDHKFDLIGLYGIDGVPLNGRLPKVLADKVDWKELAAKVPFHQIACLEL